MPRPRSILALPLLAIALAGCVETKRTTRTSFGSPSPITPVATRFDKPPERKQNDDWDLLAPFKAVGDGIGNLFPDDKSDSVKVASPSGNTLNLPKNYTGQTSFTDSNGKSYRLQYKDGALSSVEPVQKPPAEAPKPAPAPAEPKPEP
ncbi:MAG: hypothetical protein K8S99_06720 [Planctomycetes bacterium]|nr:hypothetical protein [Planctomycetota bacterium]